MDTSSTTPPCASSSPSLGSDNTNKDQEGSNKKQDQDDNNSDNTSIDQVLKRDFATLQPPPRTSVLDDDDTPVPLPPTSPHEQGTQHKHGVTNSTPVHGDERDTLITPPLENSRQVLSDDQLADHDLQKSSTYPDIPMNPVDFDPNAAPGSILIRVDKLPIPLVFKHIYNVTSAVAKPIDIYITMNRLTAFISFGKREDALRVGCYFHNSILVGGFPKNGRLQTPVPSRLDARFAEQAELDEIRMNVTNERPGWLIVEDGEFLLKKNDDWNKTDTSTSFHASRHLVNLTTGSGRRDGDNHRSHISEKIISTNRGRYQQHQQQQTQDWQEQQLQQKRIRNTMEHFHHTKETPAIFWQTAHGNPTRNQVVHEHQDYDKSLGKYYSRYTTYPPSAAPQEPLPPISAVPPPHHYHNSSTHQPHYDNYYHHQQNKGNYDPHYQSTPYYPPPQPQSVGHYGASSSHHQPSSTNGQNPPHLQYSTGYPPRTTGSHHNNHNQQQPRSSQYQQQQSSSQHHHYHQHPRSDHYYSASYPSGQPPIHPSTAPSSSTTNNSHHDPYSAPLPASGHKSSRGGYQGAPSTGRPPRQDNYYSRDRDRNY